MPERGVLGHRKSFSIKCWMVSDDMHHRLSKISLSKDALFLHIRISFDHCSCSFYSYWLLPCFMLGEFQMVVYCTYNKMPQRTCSCRIIVLSLLLAASIPFTATWHEGICSKLKPQPDTLGFPFEIGRCLIQWTYKFAIVPRFDLISIYINILYWRF